MFEDVKNSMVRLYNTPSESSAQDFFDTFFNFGIYLSNVDDLPQTAILQFTRQNQNVAQAVLLQLPTYFSILTSKLHYAYEDDADREFQLYTVCRVRSGMETFIEIFESRLRERYKEFYDNFYNEALELPKFDKELRDQLKEFPLLRKIYIPDGISSTHWWFHHPTEW